MIDFRWNDWDFYFETYEHYSFEYKRYCIGIGPLHMVFEF